MKWLLVVAALAACKSDRARDCETVRDTLRKQAMPRRYAQYATGDVAIADIDPLARLKRMTWRDPDVRAAVAAATDSGWTLYTPYSTEATAPLDKLRALCNVE